MSAWCSRPCPWAPMTMRSQPISRAISTIALAGRPRAIRVSTPTSEGSSPTAAARADRARAWSRGAAAASAEPSTATRICGSRPRRLRASVPRARSPPRRWTTTFLSASRRWWTRSGRTQGRALAVVGPRSREEGPEGATVPDGCRSTTAEWDGGSARGAELALAHPPPGAQHHAAPRGPRRASWMRGGRPAAQEAQRMRRYGGPCIATTPWAISTIALAGRPRAIRVSTPTSRAALLRRGAC